MKASASDAEVLALGAHRPHRDAPLGRARRSVLDIVGPRCQLTPSRSAGEGDGAEQHQRVRFIGRPPCRAMVSSGVRAAAALAARPRAVRRTTDVLAVAVDAVEQQPRRPSTEIVHRLADRRQRRMDARRHRRVVPSGDDHIVGNTQAGGGGGPHHPVGDLVVGAHHGVRIVPAGEQFETCLVSVLDVEAVARDEGCARASMPARRSARRTPCHRSLDVRGSGRVPEEDETPAAVARARAWSSDSAGAVLAARTLASTTDRRAGQQDDRSIGAGRSP